jgi:hypothetical protein
VLGHTHLSCPLAIWPCSAHPQRCGGWLGELAYGGCTGAVRPAVMLRWAQSGALRLAWWSLSTTTCRSRRRAWTPAKALSELETVRIVLAGCSAAFDPVRRRCPT